MVACALAANLTVLEEVAGQKAAEGRGEAVRPLLPSNPVLSSSVASRQGPTEQKLNWYFTLQQEFEVAGQRGLRVAGAHHDLQAQTQRLAATKATIAAASWELYFELIASRERVKLAVKLENATAELASTVEAMTSGGLSSELDADIATFTAIKAKQERIRVEQQAASAHAQLRSLLGIDSALTVIGELVPLRSTVVTTLKSNRPELRAAYETREALKQKIELLKRSRVPNPTLSLFVQNDGFDERVLGVGWSFPIPLPQPVGRSLFGEITETSALAERADAEAERIGRDLQLQFELAKNEYEANLQIVTLYSGERIQKTLTRLAQITTQVKAARLPVRDALVAQQSLVEQLRAEIDAREAVCVASVRLTHASGISLEGDSL